VTKALLIDPTEARQRTTLTAPALPVNAYEADPQAEAALYGGDGLRGIYLDMLTIREFETMLDRIKKEGSYEGIEYNHKGPAHLSMGQEAAAVGQAYHLTPDDFIFGSHRSHGEIIAKGLRAITQMTDADLLRVMEGYMGGAVLRVVQSFSRAQTAPPM
jgi:2-oxoisovalerate dehydrogenase E1 component